MAKILEQAGYDALDIMAGFGGNFWMKPPVYFQKGPYLSLGEAVKKEVVIPVLLAGKMGDPTLLSETLGDEKVDAVGLGRTLLADPDYPVKLTRGSFGEIRPCLYCNDGCWARQINGGIGSCTVNPQCNRELKIRVNPTGATKKVVVVGAGPAGLEAARVSALGGHSVILIEAASEMGGLLQYSSRRIHKTADHDLIAWYENQLRGLKVDIRLGTTATRSMVIKLDPELVFIASGGTPRALEFWGKDNEKVTNTLDVLSGKTFVGPKCIVIGGGLAGCEVALHLAKHRHKMTIVEAAGDILTAGEPLAPDREKMLRELLDFYHVEIMVNAGLQAVNEAGAVITQNGEDRQLLAHHVILSAGFDAASGLYQELRRERLEVYKIGHSRDVRGIRHAIWEACEVAQSI
jgi:2-enoate reductase